MKRRSRLIVLAVVTAAALVGGALIALSATQSGSERTAALAPALPEQPLFAGIEQHGPVLGSPSAPVTLVEIRRFAVPVLRRVRA